MGQLRVAVAYHWPARGDDNLARKALGQMKAWRALGAEATMFALAPGSSPVAKADELEHVHFLSDAGRKARFIRARQIGERILASRPDVVYARFATWYPYLEYIARRCPLVLELNTDDLGEMKVRAGFATRLFHNLSRGRLLSRAAGFAAMSQEIIDKALPRGSYAAVIANSIDLSAFEPLAPAHNAHPRLAFIGTPNLPWQGLENLVAFAAERPTWSFDIIGSRETEIGLAVPGNVTCHGLLPKERYLGILAAADVAVGTLALYRKGMNQTSALKTLEYSALGLPIVIGYDDVNYAADSDFILHVPNRPGGMLECAPQVDAFVERWKGRRVPRSAVAHLDVAIKERQRLDFMASAAEDWRRRNSPRP